MWQVRVRRTFSDHDVLRGACRQEPPQLPGVNDEVGGRPGIEHVEEGPKFLIGDGADTTRRKHQGLLWSVDGQALDIRQADKERLAQASRLSRVDRVSG